ncbi:MAG: hypothetical protein M1823_004462 [Watsoniomyces obsoletus]|nr:MAG: hypothetical protein M1823_004462 [Watsoniomyces obsoletus]
MATEPVPDKAKAAQEYTRQAKRLSYASRRHTGGTRARNTAVEAKFVTAHDPVVVTASGGRLPVVPLAEAKKLNRLKEQVKAYDLSAEATALMDTVAPSTDEKPSAGDTSESSESSQNGPKRDPNERHESHDASAPLRGAIPPSRTTPLFPPIPLYGPPTYLLKLQSLCFRTTSFFLSLAFLGIIVLGSIFTSIPALAKEGVVRLIGRDPDVHRPFYEEEIRRRKLRREAEKEWTSRLRRRNSQGSMPDAQAEDASSDIEFELTEGGPDPVICDIQYYARRVGLDAEEYEVQTEDGFIITLWHLFNPKEYTPGPAEHRRYRSPEVFKEDETNAEYRASLDSDQTNPKQRPRRYPVLLMHGLLQSAGAYCSNDDDSLAFWLCKSGYDVWLGDNRCGFRPRHTILKYSEPRMWAWNIRQMGVMDLPAFVSRVLSETGFKKLALISHSQGTTQAFVALAKEQRPELGQKLSVFCALAPAVYAGPLIGKAYFKFMRIISPALFRLMFGIHAFIPFMMTMHRLLPSRLYGALGYRVFSFLFDWTDTRWERDLRDRMFQFAPVYVSAESMRWWLGKDCFAKHKCILMTRDESKREEKEDEQFENGGHLQNGTIVVDGNNTDKINKAEQKQLSAGHHSGLTAWYDHQVPPFALWVAGNDDLVDGRRLLRRFERGREPHVRIVHSKVIEEYEHLDVIWAMDAIEQVGREVRNVIWRTMPEEDRRRCAIPRGCSMEDSPYRIERNS